MVRFNYLRSIQILNVDFFIAKLLQMSTRNLSTDDLFNLVKKRKVGYEQIRAVDPHRFADLEFTMKMLYDHSDIKG